MLAFHHETAWEGDDRDEVHGSWSYSSYFISFLAFCPQISWGLGQSPNSLLIHYNILIINTIWSSII